MATRMDRYYKSDDVKERSRKNASLYKQIYEESSYSNIEGIKTIEKSNEIDISQIKDLLKSRSDYQKNRDYYQIVKPVVEAPMVEEKVVEEKNYDIREILSKAKSEKPVEENHSLNKTQYDILKSLNLKQNVNRDEYIEPSLELKELIHTITSSSTLNKVDDKELSLGLLDDLKSDNNTEVLPPSVNELLKSTEMDAPEKEMDKSFFTSSLKFNDEDFEDLKDMNDNIKRNNGLMKVLIFIFVVLILVGIAYVVLFVL